MIRKVWGLPVMWTAYLGRPKVTATAETYVIHVHLHLAPGMTVPDVAGHIPALPPGSVIVPEEQEN